MGLTLENLFQDVQPVFGAQIRSRRTESIFPPLVRSAQCSRAGGFRVMTFRCRSAGSRVPEGLVVGDDQKVHKSKINEESRPKASERRMWLRCLACFRKPIALHGPGPAFLTCSTPGQSKVRRPWAWLTATIAAEHASLSSGLNRALHPGPGIRRTWPWWADREAYLLTRRRELWIALERRFYRTPGEGSASACTSTPLLDETNLRTSCWRLAGSWCCRTRERPPPTGDRLGLKGQTVVRRSVRQKTLSQR